MRKTSAMLSPEFVLYAGIAVALLMPSIAVAQVAKLTGGPIDHVFTQFDPSPNSLPNGNPNIPNNTPPLSFTLTRPSLLLITFTARVATDNPGGTQPPTVEFTAFLDGHPLLLCPGCNPSLYESTTVLGAFDTKTITWVTTAPGGPHKFDVGWGLQGPGIATVSVKTVAIEASRR
jgi:hypothetical protein